MEEHGPLTMTVTHHVELDFRLVVGSGRYEDTNEGHWSLYLRNISWVPGMLLTWYTHHLLFIKKAMGSYNKFIGLIFHDKESKDHKV